MTAAQLHASYEAVAPVFSNRPGAWLKLVHIVAAGEAGLNLSALRRSDRNPSSASNNLNLVRRWQKAGLVTITLMQRPHGRGRAPLLIRATPKARQLLRLDP